MGREVAAEAVQAEKTVEADGLADGIYGSAAFFHLFAVDLADHEIVSQGVAFELREVAPYI